MTQLTHWLGWQQPTSILSNTSYGTISASSYATNCEPYKAVDGVTSTESLGWATDNASEGWWKWVLPETLRFKRLVFVNRNSDTSDSEVLSQQCQFYIGDKETKMGKAFSVSESREYITIDCGNLESNTLYFYKLGGKYSGIGELIIEATTEKETVQEVYMSSISKVYTNNKPVVQVYNAGTLVWEDETLDPYTDVEVPVFTDNFTYGVLNSSTSAATAYRALDQVDHSTDSTLDYNCYVSTSAAPQWIMWTLPFEVLVKHITFKNNYSADGERTKTAQFFADEAMTIPLTEEFTAVDEDGGVSEFDVSAIKTDTIYCYLKEGYGTNGIVGVGEISITARKRTSASAEVLDLTKYTKFDIPVLTSNDSSSDFVVSTNNSVDQESTTDSIYKLFDEDVSNVGWTSNEVTSLEDTETETYTLWTQPTFTSNTTWGTVTASEENNPAYGALDGTLAGSSSYSNSWECTDSSGWWNWEFKETLYVEKMRLYQRADGANYYTDTAVIKTASDGETLGTVSVPKSNDGYVDLDLGDKVELNNLYISVSGSSYVGLGEIQLTAYTKKSIEPPAYVQMDLSSACTANGVTLCNGNSAIKTFEWQTSASGSTWNSLGTIQTPSFSWAVNSQCNVALPMNGAAYKHHRFIPRSLADDATVISMTELIPNFYTKNFQELNFVYPFDDIPDWVTMSNTNGWAPDSSLQAFKCNTIDNSSSTSMTMTLECSESMLLGYKLGVGSEANYDLATFSIDGTQIWSSSGTDTTESTYSLSAGSHTLTFSYSTDGSNLYNGNYMCIYYLTCIKTEDAKHLLSSITTYGSPDLTLDGVASDFSSSNYYTVNVGQSVSSKFTWVTKFSLDDNQTNQRLFGQEGYFWCCPLSGTLKDWNYSSSSWVDICSVNTDTDYWIKLECADTQRVWYLSTDGETYTQVCTDSQPSITGVSPVVSIGQDVSLPLLGKVYMAESYYQVDDGDIVYLFS